MANVLYESYQHKQKFSNRIMLYERHDIIEQDIIAKAIIMIYTKMQLGFDSTPFLATFPK